VQLIVELLVRLVRKGLRHCAALLLSFWAERLDQVGFTSLQERYRKWVLLVLLEI
jgi:hypothetical protein